MFLKDRMMAEQVDKEAIESVLQGDLKEARDTIGKEELCFCFVSNPMHLMSL